MNYRTIFHVRTHALLIALLIVISPGAFASNITPNSRGAAAPAPERRPPGTCDPQMKLIDGICRAPEKKLILTRSIVVQPDDPPYDCDDGFLVPASLRTSNDVANDPKRYQAPSSPQVGIFVPDAHHVQIRKCHLIGFDFGIFAMNGKTSAGSTAVNNTFAGNEIVAHYVGISLLSVDNTEVANNTVTLTHIGGRAINVQWNSDRNDLHHNNIAGDFDSSRGGARLAPGMTERGTLLTLPSNPSRTNSQLVFIGQMGQFENSLMTAVVDGIIYQFTLGSSAIDSDFAEDNIFEMNTLKVNLPDLSDGLSLALARRTVVQNNTIKADMKSSIRVFSQLGTPPRMFPGTCSQKAKILCVDNTECGLESGAGACQGAFSQPVGDLWTSMDNTIQANTILGPFSDMGIGTAGRGTKIFGNTIDVEPGRSAFGPVTAGGIALFGEAFGNHGRRNFGALVTRNTVSNVWPALCLAVRVAGPLSGEGFTARIGLNDFLTVYKTDKNGVRVPNAAVRVLTQPMLELPYVNQTDISINFQSKFVSFDPVIGNYWGLDSPDTFLPSGPQTSSVLVNGPPLSVGLVKDSHALDDTVSRTLSIFQVHRSGP